MSKRKIETDGITALKVFISQSSVIDPFIDSNDKTPAWDGSLVLYENPNHNSSKEHIAGKIPVQVKAKRGLPKTNQTYPFKVTDLRLYSAHGGILFLQPIFKSVDQPHIFGKLLLPHAIDRYLSTVQPTQKTKTISLEEIQTVQDLEILLEHFIENSPIFYRPRYPINLSTMEIEKQQIVIKTIATPINPIPGLLSDNAVAYVQLTDGSLLPTDMQIASVGVPQNQPIHVNGRVFFNSWMIQHDADGNITIILNDCLTLKSKKDNLQIQVCITGRTKLQEILDTVDFCNAIQDSGNFSVGESRISLKGLGNLKKISGEVLTPKIRDIELFCKEFHLDFSKVTVGDTEVYASDLNNLIPAIIHKQLMFLNDDTREHFMALRNVIGSSVLIYCQKQTNGGYHIQNYFSAIPAGNLCVTVQNETIPCNRFIGLIFFLHDPETITGLLAPYMQEIYCEIAQYYHPRLRHVYNQFLLICIHGFDFHNNTAFLKIAEQLSTFLQIDADRSDEPINAINRLQIAIRQRPLSRNEIDLLLKIRENQASEHRVQCAIALLLGSHPEFEWHFQKLPEKEQEVFQTYPIYNLCKNR